MVFKNLAKTVVLLAFASLIVAPKKSMAQYYGGPDSNVQLVLDKKVRWVPNGESMDNIDKTVKVFYGKDMIEYSVLIRNSGNTSLKNIEIRDYLPENISLIFYPGSFDVNKREISWKIEKLEPGEEKTYLIRGKIDEMASLGSNVVLQRTNKAEAKTDSLADSDTASYFIGGAAIPDTGDAGFLLESGMIISTAGFGWFLRKYARGY